MLFHNINLLVYFQVKFICIVIVKIHIIKAALQKIILL